MYLVIAGGGRVGAPLASSLVSEGHEVFILDKEESAVDAIQRELGMVASVGDATVLRSLNDAGTARAAAFIAVTDSDENNLAACQLARNNFDVPKTIATVRDPENAELFERVGIDLVVSSTDLVLANLATALPAHPLIRLMPLADRTEELVTLKIPEAGSVVGRKLSEVTLPYGASIVLLINSEGRRKNLTEDPEIQAEDEVVALSPTNTTDELWEVLTELR